MEEKMKEYVSKCLNCKVKPCSNKGCPLNNDIPKFINYVKENNMEKAYEALLDTTILGSICGRICPHYKQCMGSCIRGIKGESVKIGKIEAFISDYGLEHDFIKKIKKEDYLKGKKIAVIGGGPAGLTCSYFLVKAGANVTIFEKHNKLGGILAHGIPEFRLDKRILENTINSILNLGVKVEYGKELGNNLFLEELKKEYDAIFIGIGANISSKMNIPGEDLQGVYGGNELLEYNNHPDYKGKIVAVIGGGNVAMDTSRTLKKLGAKKVYVIYRRAEEQMPAEKKEIEDAKNEGIEFLFQNNIVRIIGESKVEKIECIKTKLVKKEGEDRLSPVNVEGSNYNINVDYVVMAVGSKPESNALNEIETNKWGYIEVDENMKAKESKIYAGGDIIGKKATVAWAARFGRIAANSIIEDLRKFVEE